MPPDCDPHKAAPSRAAVVEVFRALIEGELTPEAAERWAFAQLSAIGAYDGGFDWEAAFPDQALLQSLWDLRQAAMPGLDGAPYLFNAASYKMWLEELVNSQDQ